MHLEDPPGFIIRTEALKAAAHNGFRISRGERSGWLGFASTTARGEVWVAGASSHGPWYLSATHLGVAAELGKESGSPVDGPGLAAFAFDSLPGLYTALDRAYRLGLSLPDRPLILFLAKTGNMPRTTEAERMIVQRIGQNIFRDALLKYWNGRCPLTGIGDPRLLRASHIVAWVDCDNDAHRLDVHNGLLLSALWDAAFDCGAISFADDGTVLISPDVAQDVRTALNLSNDLKLRSLTPLHYQNLAWHRAKYGFGQ